MRTNKEFRDITNRPDGPTSKYIVNEECAEDYGACYEVFVISKEIIMSQDKYDMIVGSIFRLASYRLADRLDTIKLIYPQGRSLDVFIITRAPCGMFLISMPDDDWRLCINLDVAIGLINKYMAEERIWLWSL